MKNFLQNLPPLLGILGTLLALVTFISGFWAPHQWLLTAICVVLLSTENKQNKESYGKNY